MVEEGSQSDKLFGTSASRVRAVVGLFLVGGRVQVRVERSGGREFFVAEVALPGRAVPGLVGERILRILLKPLDLLHGDHAVGIAIADHAVDGVAVQRRGILARARFEVVGQATGRDELAFAERASVSWCRGAPASSCAAASIPSVGVTL